MDHGNSNAGYSSKHLAWIKSQRDQNSPAYLKLIQRFRSGGSYTLYKTCSSAKEAIKELDNSGQRHPGFVVQCLEINAWRKAAKEGSFNPLAKYSINIGSPILLGHAPFTSFENVLGQTMPVQDAARAEIVWVGNHGQRLKTVRKILKSAHFTAVLGICEFIGDGEMGVFDCYTQNGLNSIGMGSSKPEK
jgi:hypothetical protein